MALAVSAGCAALVLIIFLITVALGKHILEIAGLTADHPLDAVLFSSGAGFAVLQLLLGILGLGAGLTVRSVLAVLVLLAIAGGRGWKSVFRLLQESAKDLSVVFKSGAARALGVCIFFFLGLEALLSTAPLPPANGAGGRPQEICGVVSRGRSEPARVKLKYSWPGPVI
jgi:hypothetical protein